VIQLDPGKWRGRVDGVARRHLGPQYTEARCADGSAATTNNDVRNAAGNLRAAQLLI
jgi:hypothetical protein